MDFLIVILWEYSSKCNLCFCKKFNGMLIILRVPRMWLGILFTCYFYEVKIQDL